jgi:hypothetical protein
MTKSKVDASRRKKTGGRTKGTPNRATQEFRITVQKLLDDNRGNVGKWLTLVAEGAGDVKPDPGKALDLMAKLAEFAAPKLARHEHTGKDGGPVVVSTTPADQRL